jgi:hypothetical protein
MADNYELATTIEEIMALLRSNVEGLRQIPDYPPEQASDFPFLAAWPDTFRASHNVPGEMLVLHNIRFQLHVSRDDLPYDVEEACRTFERILKVLFDGNYDRAFTYMDTFGDISGTFGGMAWGAGESAVQTVGFDFVMEDAKVRTTYT